MKKVTVFSLYISLLICIAAGCSDSFDSRVKAAVNKQIELYPQSHLSDIYKSFFQDKFGPGHLLSDTAAAGRYLRQELASYSLDTVKHIIGEGTDSYGIESMGYDGNFVRVDLALIKNGTMTYEQFFNLFLNSMKEVKEVDIVAWKEEWKTVQKIIDEMNLSLPDYQSERDKIFQALEQGHYVWHHSLDFNMAYQPHYRIVSTALCQLP